MRAMLSSTFRRLMLGALLTAGGTLGVLAYDQAAAHADDSPPVVEVVEQPGGVLDLPDEAADQAKDIVEVPKTPEPPCEVPAAEETPAPPKPDHDDEPEPSKDPDKDNPGDKKDDEPAPPATGGPTPPGAPTPIGSPVGDVKDGVEDVGEVITDPPATPTPTPAVPPAPIVTPPPTTATPTPPVSQVPSAPAPDEQDDEQDGPVDSPPAKPTPAPAKPNPAPLPAPAPAPAAAVPLPVLIGPTPATGITLDGTTTIAVDDVPAAAAVLEVPLCGDEQPTPARDYPRGHVRRILDTTTGLTVTTVPADPPAKPCPGQPQGPDASTAPTVKPPTTNGVDMLAFTRDGALHHPIPALLRHIWPRAWIPDSRGEHIEPRPA